MCILFKSKQTLVLVFFFFLFLIFISFYNWFRSCSSNWLASLYFILESYDCVYFVSEKMNFEFSHFKMISFHLLSNKMDKDEEQIFAVLLIGFSRIRRRTGSGLNNISNFVNVWFMTREYSKINWDEKKWILCWIDWLINTLAALRSVCETNENDANR